MSGAMATCCPFLKETQIQHCGASELRKQIAGGPAGGPQKCASPEYLACRVYREHGAGEPAEASCPFFRESQAHYCSASAVPKFIPSNGGSQARCGNSRHRYCDVYLGSMHADSGAAPEVEGLAVPERLFYAPNHLWLEFGEDGCCQVGIDSLLARVVRPVDRVSFLPARGAARPAAVLTVGGVDLQLIFANPILVSACNVHLRADASAVSADPYRRGWLFEGRTAETDPRDGLLQGEAAREWMRGEVERLSIWVSEQVTGRAGAARTLADGGRFAPNLLPVLGREGALRLFHEFFSPLARWNK